MTRHTICAWISLVAVSMGESQLDEQTGELEIGHHGGEVTLRVVGDKDDAWVYESSPDAESWARLAEVPSVFSDHDPVTMAVSGSTGFFRARAVAGFYDPNHLRTIELSFDESNWSALMQSNYSTATLLAGDLTCEGYVYQDVGIRYKGNTSYTKSGEKKSIAIETEFTDSELEVMGYDNFNFNNAFNDESMVREALYFNSIKDYVITPNAGFIKILINGENWGVYSNVQQQDGTLLDEWFDDNDGDRWKSPSGTGAGGDETGATTREPGGGGGGGGGFTSGDKALLYLGDDPAAYQEKYELKTQNSEDPWAHLIAATKHLNDVSPTSAEYRESMDTAFAVDRWLWFLAAENIFTDDDSYWHKGADYQIYYEPGSGQLHPIEHDGNEAFTVRDADLDPMYYEDNENRPVLSKFLSNPELRQRYLAHVRTILAERFNPTHLHPLIDEYHALIAAEVALDPKKDFTVAEFEADIANLKTHIEDRHDYLLAHAEVAQTAPTITSVSEPTATVAGQPVNITATVAAHGTDGLSAVHVYYRRGESGQYLDVEMFDDGLHGDGAAGDGVYGGDIPGFLAGQKVRYYVEAISGNAFGSAVYNPARAELDPYDFRMGTEAATSTSVVINEFMSLNDSAVTDPQGEYDDWIELRNLSDTEIDLAGMYLSDNASNPRKWDFPEGTTIPASGYLIIWADEDGSDTPGLHANFKLSGSGEEILLVDTDANLNVVLDHVEYDLGQTDISIGRSVADPDQFEPMTPTPGFANQ